MICRHGFRRHECLAPSCENATPRAWPKVGPSAASLTQTPAPKPEARRRGQRTPKREKLPQLITLDAAEADRVRALIDARGAEKAAKALGLSCAGTLYKAAALLPCSRLSITTIRLHLERRV